MFERIFKGGVNVDITEELPTVISFCSGYGGIERGLELSGYNHRLIAFCEIEAYVQKLTLEKMEKGQMVSAPLWTDLKTFPAQIFRDKVDLLLAGYPCQPFSQAGRRGGPDDPRHLWPCIKEHIRTIRPVRCFFENVQGHITLGLSTVISDLEELGYRATWGIFSAEEVGAPHQRKRVFILADATSQQIQRVRPNREQELSTLDEKKIFDRSSYEFPAGPGQEQHEWEEPRVV